uniref:Uncharacterized protein n=1 Tax=Glossina austeni TaxID=7395 RepID=A0A1A9UZE8_GLOAU
MLLEFAAAAALLFLRNFCILWWATWEWEGWGECVEWTKNNPTLTGNQRKAKRKFSIFGTNDNISSVTRQPFKLRTDLGSRFFNKLSSRKSKSSGFGPAKLIADVMPNCLTCCCCCWLFCECEFRAPLPPPALFAV